jgi:lysozyme
MADRVVRIAMALVEKREHFREYAYPDPYSPLGKATRGKRWGFVPAMDILHDLPANVAALRGDPWTCGFGQTGKYVGPATRWSREVALANFETEIEYVRAGVRRLARPDMTVGQEVALISFAYNVGLDEDADTIPEGLGDSTLLKYFNVGDVVRAAEEFVKWKRAGGEVSRGLELRRLEERLMFIGQHPFLGSIQ